MRALTGGTASRAGIQLGLLRALGVRLRGQPCQEYGSVLKVRTQTGIRYPDALVTCTRPTPTSTVAPDPVVIFEILSRSTARIDLGAKNAEYQSIASLRLYVVLDPFRVAAQVFRRNDEGDWIYEALGPEGSLDMPEIGVAVPLAEIYEDVELARRFGLVFATQAIYIAGCIDLACRMFCSRLMGA